MPTSALSYQYQAVLLCSWGSAEIHRHAYEPKGQISHLLKVQPFFYSISTNAHWPEKHFCSDLFADVLKRTDGFWEAISLVGDERRKRLF